jgi:hypothetical protein
MTKQKLYALCGLLWFAMDVAWYWHSFATALFFGIMTAITGVAGLLIYYRSKSTEYYIVLATFSWIMLNMCSLVKDTFAPLESETLIGFANLFAFIFSFIGAQALIAVGINNSDLFDKFKKL